MSYLTNAKEDVHPTWSNSLRRDETGRLVRGQVAPRTVQRSLDRQRSHTARPSRTHQPSMARTSTHTRTSSWDDYQGTNVSYGAPLGDDSWRTQRANNVPVWHSLSTGYGHRPPQPCDPFAPQSTSFPLSRTAPAPQQAWSKTIDPAHRQPLHAGKQPYFASAAFRRHHVPGYAGHLQTGQFEFGRSIGRISRDVLLYQNGRPKQGYKDLIP